MNFLLSVIENIAFIYENHILEPVLIVMSDVEEDDFKKSYNCHICNTPLLLDRVRDHCHFTGKFRGAAHNACNLKYKVPKFIPVFFHNFTRYHCHLFIKDLAIIPGEIKVIPLNKEQYISISKIITISNGDCFEIRFDLCLLH